MVECGGGQSSAFLEFRTNAEAEAVMNEFNCRLFSEEDNISFLNLSTRKARPEIKSKINYVFLHWRSLCKNEVTLSTSLNHQNKLFKTLPELKKYIKELKAKSSLVCVLESVDSLEKLNQICDNQTNQMFCGWVDLNQLVMSRYDASYIKYSSNDETRLPSLLYQTYPDLDTDQPDGFKSEMMKLIFEGHDNPESRIQVTSLNPDHHHLVMLLDIGLVRFNSLEEGRNSGGSVMASLAVRTAQSSFNCGIDLSSYTEDSLDWDSAKMLGLHLSTSGTWLKDSQPCLSEKSCLDQLLHFMSKGLESTIGEDKRSARVGGVILTTILHEDSLLYLCAAMKRHGLFKQFENVVAGFCHLETVFKRRNICRKVFSLRYLDRYLQSVGVACTGEYGNLESERSEVLARVGYEALNHIMDGNIMTDEFFHEYCYPIRSGIFNSLLEDSIHKSDLSIFDPEVCESRLHHSVTLLPGQTTSLTVMVTPALASYTNTVLQFIPECLPQQNLYKVITDTQRTNPSGMMLVKVLNQTRNKIRLPKGLYFGLLRLSNQPDQQIEPEISIVKTISNYPRVDLERIKIEPSSDSSDESVAGEPDALKCTDEDTVDDEDAKKQDTSSSSFPSETPDLEFIIASKASDFFATNDILQELSDQLNPEAPSGWEDLNPTFSSLGISSTLSDVDMDLPIFDDIASGINISDENNKAGLQLDLGIPLDSFKSGDTVTNLCIGNEIKDLPENDAKVITPAAENPLKRMPKQGVTLSKEKPLLPQLKIIKKTIENNKVEGDLSIQFPSLIGEEDYIPLYKTLMQYTGLTLDDLSYDFVEFGEKVYSEILNFDLSNGLDELGDIMKELYDENKDANVETWALKFSERFSSLMDINDLNGENFDLMLVQFILLHFCQNWQSSEYSEDTNIRDMYGFPETEGYDMVLSSDQQLSQTPSISSETVAPSSTLSADTNGFDFQRSTFIEDSGLPEQILEAVALASAEPILQRLCFPPPDNHVDIQEDNNCDMNEIKDGDEMNKDSNDCSDTLKDVNENQESLIENVSNDLIPEELNPVSSIVSPDASIHTSKEIKSSSTDFESQLLPNASEKFANSIDESITHNDDNQEDLVVSKQQEDKNSSEIFVNKNSELFLVQNEKSLIQETPMKVSEVDISQLNDSHNSKEETTKSINTPSEETTPSKNSAKEKRSSDDLKHREQSSSKRSNKSDTTNKSKDKSVTEKSKSPGSSNNKLKVVQDTSKAVIKEEEPPFDGDKNFDNLYLAIKMHATKEQSSILVFVGDMPRNSVITGSMLLVHGKQQNNQVHVQDILEKAEDGDGDTMLVLIKSLDQDQAQVKLAVPLALWQDNKYFFKGFILFRESKDRYRGAFMNKNKLETVSIDISRIKNFDGESDTPLEPGVEVNLMVKAREAIGAMQPKYRATLCIPDPEKRCYDLLETTYWTAKTRTHFTEPDTVHDIAENCGNGIHLHVLNEKERNFFIIRGKDKKSCIDSFNKIIQARNLFEQLPGNRPKSNTTLEIMIDSVPFTKTCIRPVNLMSLQLTAHYTGTSLRIMDDELAIEGRRQDLVELARHALTFALTKTSKEQVQIGSVMSTSGPDLQAKPSQGSKPVTSTSTRTSHQKPVVRPTVNVKPLNPVLKQIQAQVDEDEVTSTTSEDVVNKKVEVFVVEERTESPNPSPSAMEPSPSTLGSAAPLLTTVDDEEETLKQIFYTECPKLETKTTPSPRKQSQVHRIPLKLGKSFSMAPGDTRSITLALKQKLTKKYITRTHAHFDKFLDKIKVVLELVNGSNVIVDLENISKSSVELSSEQYIVTLVERIPKVNKSEITSMPTGPGFVRKQQVSKGGIKIPSMQQSKPIKQPSPTMTVAGGEKSQIPVKKYKVCLQENISIPGKSVSYAHVAVVNGDTHVFNKVHEIRRHPDFKNNAIFVPERQKKKICEAVKLHMSIRNRVDTPTSVAKGTLVGQIVVPMPLVEKDKKSNKRSSPNNSMTSNAKRIKQHPQAERSSSRNSNSSGGGSTGRRTPEPENLTTSSVDKEKLLAIIKNAVIMTKKSASSSKQDRSSSANKQSIDDKNISGSNSSTLDSSDTALEDEVPCSHDQLRGQACKNIMLGLECKDAKCQDMNQHKLPLDFVMLRNKEFCLDYLRKRVCAKSFHPFVCKAEYHVYDVMEIVKFYADYVEELKDNCGWCRKIQQEEDAKKGGEKSVAKDCVVIALDKAKVTEISETQNKTSPTSSKSLASEPPNNKSEIAADPLKSKTNISGVDTNVSNGPLTVTASQEKLGSSQATVTKQVEPEASISGNKISSLLSRKDSQEPEIQAVAVKIVRPIDTDIETVCLDDQESSIEDDMDDIQIIDVPDIATFPLKLSCAHITMNSSLCPRLGRCKNKTCPHAHTISPSLKLTYCSSYLESGQCSQLSTCTALHVDYDDLQELYLQALRKAVLTCNKCFFNCKLFNPKKKKHRQSRICFKDFTAYCRNKQECLFIHFEELGHLDMLPPCKIFASREMCPKRSTEKGVVHMTHRNYQNKLFKKINQQARKCNTCSGDLETLQVHLDQRISNNSRTNDDAVPINEKVDKADEGAANVFEDMPDLETVSDEESDQLFASTSNKTCSVEPSESVQTVTDDAKDNAEVSSTCKSNDAEALGKMYNPLNNQNKPFSSLTRILEDRSRSPTPNVVPSHSRLPPTLAPCSRIQIVKPKISNPRTGFDAGSSLSNPSTSSNVQVQENTKVIMSEAKTPSEQNVSNKSDTTTSNGTKSLTKAPKEPENCINSESKVSGVGSDKNTISANKPATTTSSATFIRTPSTALPTTSTKKIPTTNTTLSTQTTEPKTLTTPSTKPRTVTTPSTTYTTMSTTLTITSTKSTTLTTPSTKPTTSTPTTKSTTSTTPSTKPTTLSTPTTKPTTLTTPSTKPTTLSTPSTKPTTSTKPTEITTLSLKSTSLTAPSVNLTTLTTNSSTTTKSVRPTATSTHKTETTTSLTKSITSSKSETSQSRSTQSKNTNTSASGRNANASSTFKRTGGHMDSYNQPPFKTARRVCQFFGSITKCKNGNKCPNIHDLSLLTCRFWKAGYCQYGNMCKRKHAY